MQGENRLVILKITWPEVHVGTPKGRSWDTELSSLWLEIDIQSEIMHSLH